MNEFDDIDSGRKRRLIIIGIVVLALLVAAFFGARPAYRVVKTWRAHRFAEEGEALITQQKWDGAYRKAQAALQLSPQDTRSMRLMARLLSYFGQESAIAFWDHLLKSPNSIPSDRIEIITVALRLRQWAVAKTNLAEALKVKPVPAQVLQLASDFFGDQGDIVQAIKFARAAAESKADDPATTLFLARRLLISNDPKDNQQAKTLLWQLSGGKDTNALEALLILPNYARLTPEEVDDCIGKLQNHPERTLANEFFALDLKLRRAPAERANIFAGAIKKFSSLGDEAVLQLGRWLNRNKEFDQVLRVISFTKALTSQELFLVHVDALAGLGRWSDVEIALGARNVPLEPFIIALYRVRVAKELGQHQLVPLQWVQAQRRAADSPQSLSYLAQYAEKLGAFDEAAKAYRQMTAKPQTARVAYVALLRLAQQNGTTRDLRALMKEMTEQFPKDSVPHNDLAYLNLLLGEDMEAAKAVSLKLFQENPNLLAYRITLSLAHLRFNENAAAMALYKDLDFNWSSALPGWQAVHAAVLGSNGETNSAQLLARQIPAKQLKPEELALIQRWL